jgi:hypothetical protein
MTQQAVGQWADKAPSDCVQLENGRRWLIWPQFPVWYRQRLQATREKPLNVAEAQQRRAAAEAEIAEMERDKMRGDLVPADTLDRLVGDIGDTLAAILKAIPGRYAARTVGLTTLPESQRAWELAIRDVLGDLRRGDGAR